VDYFDYGEHFQDEWGDDAGFDVEEFLEQSQRQEQQRLEEELERIQRELSCRDKIHQDVVQELESKLDWYIDRLERHYLRGGHGTEDREQLKEEIRRFYTELREERKSHWNDKQKLESKKRELHRKISELEDSSLDFL